VLSHLFGNISQKKTYKKEYGVQKISPSTYSTNPVVVPCAVTYTFPILYTICYRYIFGVHRRRDRATLQTRVLMFSSSLQDKNSISILYLSIDVCVCVSLRNRLLLHGTNTRAKNMSFVLSYIRKNRAKALVKRHS